MGPAEVFKFAETLEPRVRAKETLDCATTSWYGPGLAGYRVASPKSERSRTFVLSYGGLDTRVSAILTRAKPACKLNQQIAGPPTQWRPGLCC